MVVVWTKLAGLADNLAGEATRWKSGHEYGGGVSGKGVVV